ncbi:hypothetical protein [Wenxinia marina]|uniref:Uncharacterized protein n=1 Tax=Wenxinia marina DSM 24838 TaxID=1123501 RepID=A0A0D0Q5N1_9RHOB|nr:hypothetical protein [Wenxinia marina]KIQ67797.1 hypothetical protein Wenmar_03526 [Wenxinia marina DSM 24838]GGL74992.1 hypothetical protein GCM10011392_32010 [Wenxinia marina]
MTIRICANPLEARLIERDGLGWGLDYACGCLDAVTDGARRQRRRLVRRLIDAVARRTA